MTSRIEQFKQIQEEGLELFSKKNKDYGDGFTKYGTIGVIVRIGDKIERLTSVTKNRISLIHNESLRDTLIDLHNYTAMALILIDENSEKDKQKAKSNENTNNCAKPYLLDYVV